jgi:hypothetical protein
VSLLVVGVVCFVLFAREQRQTKQNTQHRTPIKTQATVGTRQRTKANKTKHTTVDTRQRTKANKAKHTTPTTNKDTNNSGHKTENKGKQNKTDNTEFQ